MACTVGFGTCNANNMHRFMMGFSEKLNFPCYKYENV